MHTPYSLSSCTEASSPNPPSCPSPTNYQGDAGACLRLWALSLRQGMLYPSLQLICKDHFSTGWGLFQAYTAASDSGSQELVSGAFLFRTSVPFVTFFGQQCECFIQFTWSSAPFLRDSRRKKSSCNKMVMLARCIFRCIFLPQTLISSSDNTLCNVNNCIWDSFPILLSLCCSFPQNHFYLQKRKQSTHSIGQYPVKLETNAWLL